MLMMLTLCVFEPERRCPDGKCAGGNMSTFFVFTAGEAELRVASRMPCRCHRRCRRRAPGLEHQDFLPGGARTLTRPARKTKK